MLSCRETWELTLLSAPPKTQISSICLFYTLIMAKRRTWLRRLMVLGGFLAGLLFLGIAAVVLILMRKPLSGAILEPPPPNQLLQIAETTASPRRPSPPPIDSKNPPKSYRQYLEYCLQHGSDEGTRLFLEISGKLDEKF